MRNIYEVDYGDQVRLVIDFYNNMPMIHRHLFKGRDINFCPEATWAIDMIDIYGSGKVEDDCLYITDEDTGDRLGEVFVAGISGGDKKYVVGITYEAVEQYGSMQKALIAAFDSQHITMESENIDWSIVMGVILIKKDGIQTFEEVG